MWALAQICAKLRESATTVKLASACLFRLAWLGRGEGIWAGFGLESRKTTKESQVNQADILKSSALIYYI